MSLLGQTARRRIDPLLEAMERRSAGERVPLQPLFSDDTAPVADDSSLNREDPTVVPRYPENHFEPERVQDTSPPAQTDASDVAFQERFNALQEAEANPRPLPPNPSTVTFKGVQRYEVNDQIPAGADGVPADERSKVRELDKPIGKLPAALSGDALGDYVAGAMRRTAEQRLGAPVQATIINRSGLRASSLPAGDVPASSVYQALPFEDPLVAVDVPGAQLGDFMSRNGRSMAVNGDVSNLDPNKTYTVAVPRYLIDRGGGKSLQGATNIRSLESKPRDAVLDLLSGRVASPSAVSAPASAVPAPAASAAQTASASSSASDPATGITPRRPRSEDLMDELALEERTPAQDRNGRVKSAALQALHQAGENVNAQLASGRPFDMYALASVIGGGLGGALAGGVRPEMDEAQKRQARINHLGIQVRQTVAAERAQAQNARLAGQGQPTPAQLATQQRGFSNYLAKFFPSGYTRGTRPDVDRELDRLQMDPPPPLPKKGGNGRGYVLAPGQAIAVPDGRGGFVYQIPHDEAGNPMPDQTTTQREMSEADRQRIEIQLAQLNLQRAKLKLRPVTFQEFVDGGGDTPTEAPAATPPSAPSGTPSGTPPATAPATAPQGNSMGIVPRSPKLVVNKNAKPEPVTSSGIRPRGRRGGSSGSGNERDIGFAESGAADSQARATEARERAAKLKGEGKDDEAAAAERSAAAWDRKAKVEQNRLQRAGGAPRGSAGTVGTPKQYTEKEIRAMAVSDGKDPDAAVRYARQNGRLKRGN